MTKILKYGGPNHPSCHLFKDLNQAAAYICLPPILSKEQVLTCLMNSAEIIDFEETTWIILEDQYIIDHTRS